MNSNCNQARALGQRVLQGPPTIKEFYFDFDTLGKMLSEAGAGQELTAKLAGSIKDRTHE